MSWALFSFSRIQRREDRRASCHVAIMIVFAFYSPTESPSTFAKVIKVNKSLRSALAINVSTIKVKCRSILLIVPGDFTPWGTNEWDEHVQAVLENARTSIAASEAEVVGFRKELDRLRSEVRSLRETLTAPSGTPSIEAVAERIRLDQRVERLEELNAFFKETMAAFANLADDWEI